MNNYPETQALSEPSLRHLKAMRCFFEKYETPSMPSLFYRKLLSACYNRFIPDTSSVLEIGCGSGELLQLINARKKTGVDLSAHRIEQAKEKNPGASFFIQAGEELDINDTFDYIIISDTLNYAADILLLLERLHSVSHENTRVIINIYNTLWKPILQLTQVLRLKSQEPETSWLSQKDVVSFCRLAGWDVICTSSHILVPLNLFGMEKLINRFLAPFFPPLCLSIFFTVRPCKKTTPKDQSVSVIIPARNEQGNIESAILRTPRMGSSTELIFVEGGSSDATWEEILRVKNAYPELPIKAFQQKGKGKGDAVRLGFSKASGDILMILDADLTTPPEDLPKFYRVIASGDADFANGVRLVYPLENEAMQFLNMCANKLFGIIFSWLLNQTIKDTLCGTKVLTRNNYEVLADHRSFFGEFDPFGDFDLLFGAGKLNYKIVDVAVRYANRDYGNTNISRWRHGWLLLRMVWVAARKLKFAK